MAKKKISGKFYALLWSLLMIFGFVFCMAPAGRLAGEGGKMFMVEIIFALGQVAFYLLSELVFALFALKGVRATPEPEIVWSPQGYVPLPKFNRKKVKYTSKFYNLLFRLILAVLIGLWSFLFTLLGLNVIKFLTPFHLDLLGFLIVVLALIPNCCLTVYHLWPTTSAKLHQILGQTFARIFHLEIDHYEFQRPFFLKKK